MTSRFAWILRSQFLVFALLALGLGAALIYFSRGQVGPVAPPTPVTVVEAYTVAPQPIEVGLESVGTLRANESVILRPEIVGRIVDIPVEEGSSVKKGDVLFKIDDRLARAELKQAEANLRLARLEYARYAKLAKTGAATRRLFDQSQANLGVAEANADLARTKVDYTLIRAPFDGNMGLRKVSPGDYVNVGQELAAVICHDPMKVDFTIPETRAAALAVGQKIEMQVEALPGQTFVGEVYALDPQADVGGRALALRARVDNPDGTLKPGYFARVNLVLEKKENALLVPEGAIIPQGNDKFVYKITPESIVVLTPVALGERLAEGKVEVVQGVASGDRVVTSGQIKLRDGAKVSIARSAPAARAASAAAE